MSSTKNMSTESSKKSDKNSVTMESKIVLDNGDMYPVTPYSSKECVNSASQSTPMNENKDCPNTPMEDVFTPGHEKLMLGTNHIRNLENPGSSVARRLKFRSKSGGAEEECVSGSKSDDGSFMENVYESMLDNIISKQAEDILEEILAPDVFMTPLSVNRLPWDAETCPGAPMKPVAVRKSRNVATSTCRKFEF